MTERWWCGAHDCRAVVTGRQGRADHQREEHPDLYGVLYLPYERPDDGPTPKETDEHRSTGT